MKKTALFVMVSLSMTSFGQSQKTKTMNYPVTAKGETVDTYFGQKVNDPYRWLEDDKSEQTQAWVKAQNKVTYDYLAKIPYRNAIKARMEKIWNYEKIGAPSTEGGFQYFYKNNGLQNQSVFYRRNAAGKEEVFLDPNTFSKQGTTSLGEVEFTKDGSKAVYSISEGGSDWRKVMVVDALTKKITEDTLVDVKFGKLAWKGNEGFYYSSYDKPVGSELSAKTDQHKLYFHKLGTSQKDDKVIFGLDKKRRYVSADVTEDGRYLIIEAANSTSGNELYIKDLSNANNPIVTIVDNFNTNSSIVDSYDDILYIETDLNAPNNRVVSVNFRNPQPQNWKDVIAETSEVMTLSKGGGYFFVNYLKDAVSVVKQYDYSGKLVREIQLPGLGTAGGFSAKKEERTIYYTFSNYVTPSSVFALDAITGKSQIYQKPNVDFNGDNYVSKQVFYTSKDGTKIPMIITYRKDLKLDGKNPTILYGYGGFNHSLTPAFSISTAVWMENGGIFAAANLRGGGEYGKKWHDAGIKLNKQNVFDDFIAAAEFLIAQKYTSSDYLAVRGGSNGGLLVGAAMTQRPDLMKVALPAVGVMDMLRYHKFTAGAGWAYDYGTSDDNKEMFEYLKGYSPVHNVEKGVHYPATLVTTGDHDDRVVPAHSFKFAAELQENQAGTNPVLIRIDVKAGHGAGKSVAAVIQENVDVQAFTLYNMGVKELPKK